jgi:vitamin B12 transporter
MFDGLTGAGLALVSAFWCLNHFVKMQVRVAGFFMQLVLLIGFSGNCLAQSITDSVFEVPAVVINAPRNQYFRENTRNDVFSGEELKGSAGESLGSFLAGHSALNIRSYGTGGGVASLSLRGVSNSQVQVNWNGFPINSVTLGSCDFSLIPAGGFDRVSVIYGASGSLFGSGTFGGAVNLESRLSPGEGSEGYARISYQSLKSFSGSGYFRIGNSKAALKSILWGTSSANEFSYFDYIRQSPRKQTDGEWNDAGLIQNAVWRLSATSSLEAGLWWQVKKINIPSRIGSTSFEFQKDSTFKVFAGYKKSGAHWGLQVKGAMFRSAQLYRQKASAETELFSIDSRIRSNQLYGDVNYRVYLKPCFSLDVGATGTRFTADVSAYRGRKEENGLALFSGVKYTKKLFSWQAEIRKEWNSSFHSGILPSFGIVWKATSEKWSVRANFSEKFRKPTFNDLYWIPGGNSSLKPETGFSLDLGSSILLFQAKKTGITGDFDFYWSGIKNMIVWRPAVVYWSAENFRVVRSYGMDGKINLDTRIHRWKYHSSLMIMLNRAVEKTSSGDKPMLYAPRIITSFENLLTAGMFEFTLWHHFSADRFYDDNSVLDPFQTLDFRIGARVPTGKNSLGMQFTVYNLTGATYELVRLYPMPGRNWLVTLNYSFK